MVKYVLSLITLLVVSLISYQVGRQETELRWTQEREKILAQQIQTLQRKDRAIAELEKSIGVLNDSALRVRERDAAIQRRLQRELGSCSRFRPALEKCSATLSQCAEHAVSDRRIIERCAVQLR